MKKSFSLVEILVFVTVLSVFFVAAMSILTYSLINMKVNEHKILASHYAGEALEWIKEEKDKDWNVFFALDSNPESTTYCLNSLSWSSGSCTTYDLGSPSPIFKREAVLDSQTSPERVNATVNVYWVEGSDVFSVSLNSVLTILE